MRIANKISCIFVLVMASFTMQAAEPTARTFQQIIASGQLRVGVALVSPWALRAKDGQLIGSELDMTRRLARDMGVEPQVGVYEWEHLITALEKGEIDIVIAGMAVQPDRALRINFSQPYASSGINIAANKTMTMGFNDISAMKQPNVVIGVVKGSISADVAKRMFPKTTIKLFDDLPLVEKALLDGKLHAMIASNPQPTFLALTHPDKIDVPLAQSLINFREAFAVAKGDYEFLRFLDSWVIAREADGWIDSTRHYWFETLKWREQVKQ